MGNHPRKAYFLKGDSMGRKAKKEDNPKVQLATKRKMQKRGQNTVYYILFATLCIAVGIVMSFTVFFRIDLIKVSSNEATSRYAEDDIIRTSGITLGDNLFRLDGKEIKERLLKTYPYIEEVSFKRMLPSIMEIKLTMSEPFAAIDIGEWNLVVDKNGRVLDQIAKNDPNSPTYRS